MARSRCTPPGRSKRSKSLPPNWGPARRWLGSKGALGNLPFQIYIATEPQPPGGRHRFFHSVVFESLWVSFPTACCANGKEIVLLMIPRRLLRGNSLKYFGEGAKISTNKSHVNIFRNFIYFVLIIDYVRFHREAIPNSRKRNSGGSSTSMGFPGSPGTRWDGQAQHLDKQVSTNRGRVPRAFTRERCGTSSWAIL